MSEDAGQDPSDVTALAAKVEGLTHAVQQLLGVVSTLNQSAQRSVDLSYAALEADVRLTHVMRVLTDLAGQEESARTGNASLKAILAGCTKELDITQTVLADAVKRKVPA